MPRATLSPRDLVRAGAAAFGDRPAVISGGERLTYRQLAARTHEVAGLLERVGVGPGVQVALMIPNSVAHVAWYYGVLEAGAVVMPLAPTLVAAEIGARIDGARFLATAGSSPPPGADRMDDAAADEVALWRVRTPPSLAAMPGAMLRHCSSGSTGRPNHMLKTEANVAFDLDATGSVLGVDEGDVFLAALPFHTQHGAKQFSLPFSVGASVSILRRFLPGAVLAATQRDRVTVMPTSAPLVEALSACMLRAGEERALRGLRHCLSAGSCLRREVQRAFRERFGIAVREVYGSTETMRVSIDLDERMEEGRCGRPLPGVEVGIFDDEGKPAPPRASGRIGVRSPACSLEYLGDPEATARVFRGGWVFPGDRGHLDRRGCLHLLGRDDILSIGGQKVDPLEVERAIRDALPVRDVVVVGAERAGLPAIAAFIEADAALVTRAMVLAACRARLSRHKVPARIEIRADLPRDAMGKVSRSSLTGNRCAAAPARPSPGTRG